MRLLRPSLAITRCGLDLLAPVAWSSWLVSPRTPGRRRAPAAPCEDLTPLAADCRRNSWPPRAHCRPLRNTWNVVPVMEIRRHQLGGRASASGMLASVGRSSPPHGPTEGVERAVSLDHTFILHRLSGLHQQREVRALRGPPPMHSTRRRFGVIAIPGVRIVRHKRLVSTMGRARVRCGNRG